MVTSSDVAEQVGGLLWDAGPEEGEYDEDGDGHALIPTKSESPDARTTRARLTRRALGSGNRLSACPLSQPGRMP